jgi:hypothetical protein
MLDGLMLAASNAPQRDVDVHIKNWLFTERRQCKFQALQRRVVGGQKQAQCEI